MHTRERDFPGIFIPAGRPDRSGTGFMTQDCSRLKFVSAFFFFPMRSLLGRIGLRYDISADRQCLLPGGVRPDSRGRQGGHPSPLPDRGEMQGPFFQGGRGPLREVQTLPLRGDPRFSARRRGGGSSSLPARTSRNGLSSGRGSARRSAPPVISRSKRGSVRPRSPSGGSV